MDKEQIEQGDKIIAEFMEWQKDFAHKTDKYGYAQSIDGYITPFLNHNGHSDDSDRHIFATEGLLFHSSWDWLMLVVEKIEKQVAEFRVAFHYPEYLVQISRPRFESSLFRGESKIQAVYLACIEFINWYDAHKR